MGSKTVLRQVLHETSFRSSKEVREEEDRRVEDRKETRVDRKEGKSQRRKGCRKSCKSCRQSCKILVEASGWRTRRHNATTAQHNIANQSTPTTRQRKNQSQGCPFFFVNSPLLRPADSLPNTKITLCSKQLAHTHTLVILFEA